MKRKRIAYIQYTNPAGYPPLEHSSRILADDGWEVLFLGTGAAGTDKLRFPEHDHISVRKLPFQEAGWKQKFHFLVFQLWCLRWLLRWGPSWVYVSDLLSCPAGLLCGFMGIKVIFHEHDSPAADAQGLVQRTLLWTRKRCANRASLCVIPNSQRGEYAKESLGLRRLPLVVWNCPRLEEVTPPRAAFAGQGLRLLYHGSIVPDRLPQAVIDALALLPPDVSITIVGYETLGTPGYIDQLRRKAEELGVGERLYVKGTLATREELMSVCRNHDVGFALMPASSGDLNLRTMAGASNKPFDYLACGLALLVSELPEWEQMFVQPGYGLACNPVSVDSLVAAISRFYEDAEEMRAMGERGRQRILREWNYEYQFRPVKDQLEGQPSGVAVKVGQEALL
ncbi:MAG TPA: glycosyltransferase [Bryobacteraceae bacterium]|nr:glycosyltransferase [Bryobacteraceae bacterium]